MRKEESVFSKEGKKHLCANTAGIKVANATSVQDGTGGLPCFANIAIIPPMLRGEFLEPVALRALSRGRRRGGEGRSKDGKKMKVNTRARVWVAGHCNVLYLSPQQRQQISLMLRCKDDTTITGHNFELALAVLNCLD